MTAWIQELLAARLFRVFALSCSSFLMHEDFPGESTVKESNTTQKMFILRFHTTFLPTEINISNQREIVICSNFKHIISYIYFCSNKFHL